LSPVSGVRANGATGLARYAAPVRCCFVICVALAAVGAAGCEDKGVAHMTLLKNAVCACKTTACAEAQLKGGADHVESNHRTQALAQQMVECLAKLYDDERPSTDPDTEAPAPADPAPAAAKAP
jgi:hypothetical protein